MSGTDLTGGGAPLGFLLQLLVALLGPIVELLGLLVALFRLIVALPCLVQEALSGGDIPTLQGSVVVVPPHLVELLLGSVPLGFALLEDTLGVLSVCVL